PSAAPSESGASFRINFPPLRNSLQIPTCDSPARKREREPVSTAARAADTISGQDKFNRRRVGFDHPDATLWLKTATHGVDCRPRRNRSIENRFD
ncbi:hypothetical protein, partial [Rhodopseudomonas rhenobacensis]|uniref:hypothetical protein n=1 Tax=Rhodopseudomonas rhenobacensis TaxID=87461 RepID=UPI001AEEF772